MKLIIAIFILALGLDPAVYAQNRKQITEEIALGSTSSIEINNKKNIVIEILPWDGSNLKIAFEYDTAQSLPDDATGKLSSFRFEVKQEAGKTIVLSHPLPSKAKIQSLPDKPSTRASDDYVVIDGKTYYRKDPPSLPQQPKAAPSIPMRSKAIFYVPKGKKLVIINTSSGEIIFPQDMDEADVEMNGGTLQTRGCRKLNLKSLFADINLGNIDEATIQIHGGQLSIDKINQLVIDSKYTQPRIRMAGTVHLSSSLADNYTFEELDALTGTKTFGSCIIGTLKTKINMEKGRGMSLQIKNILPDAVLIRVISTDDSLVLPVWNLTNYSIDINAPNNSELWLTDAIRNGASTVPVTFGNAGSVKFNSKVGDTSGKHTAFVIECYSCVIKFN